MNRFGILSAVLALFTALTGTASAQQNTLNNLGPAPELENLVFLNTETPLRLADLRGQVVLLEFWTFDCINCIRTLPYIQAWHETYADQGLVVIGNHYPEFSYERDLGNVMAAVERLGLTYPIAQDNDRATWGAYNQRYWPTVILIDKAGNIRYRHIGEGRYDRTESVIQTLLAEPYDAPETIAAEVPARSFITPTQPLNVRTGPGTNHQRLGTVMPGALFVVLGETDGWYEIQYDGEDGRYVSGEYVTLGTW